MSDILNIVEGGLEQGIIWGILVIGVYISFRILDVADLSIEGTFPLGGCVAGVLIYGGVNPLLATILALISGLLGGLLTGVLHTKLKIPAILSGIITMTALSSVNLIILGFSDSTRTTLSTLSIDNDIFSSVNKIISPFLDNIGISKANSLSVVTIIIGGIFLLFVIFGIYFLFGTEIGMNIRATGNNSAMARAQGINTDSMIIIGLMLSNGLIALSGALFAQSSSIVTVDNGRGAIVIGLAGIILGELIFGRKKSFKVSLISIVVGSIVFFMIKNIAISLNVDYLLNLILALMLALILALPLIKRKRKSKTMGDGLGA